MGSIWRKRVSQVDPVRIYLFRLLAFLLMMESHTSLSMDRDKPQPRCAAVESVAKDAKKIAYLKRWVSENIADKDFLKLMGWLGTVRSIDNPEMMNRLNIDWDYLGIESRRSSVTLNREYADRDQFLDPQNIKSISFGEGRSFIIIRTNESEHLGLSDDALKRMRLMAPNVYVFCETYYSPSA